MITQQLALSIGNTGQLGQYQISLPNGITQIVNMNINQILHNAITLILSASALLAFIFLVIGGIRWIMSQGDKKQLETAQKTITYAIIGLVVVLLSFFIINFIGYLFGVKLLN